jgi:hypothetical protein
MKILKQKMFKMKKEIENLKAEIRVVRYLVLLIYVSGFCYVLVDMCMRDGAFK